MADSEEAAPAPRAPPPPPVQVAYCPITGIPPEYNDYLPKDSDEFRKWKASQSAGAGDEAASAVSAGMEGLSVEAKEGEGPAASIPADAAEEKAKPSKKKKATKAVTIEANKRQKNKTTTVVTGLDLFDIKLTEAAKIFKTKFACGCSVVKNPSLVEQIEIQGDFVDKVAELMLKTYEKSHQVNKEVIYVVEVVGDEETKKKKKRLYFGAGDDEDD